MSDTLNVILYAAPHYTEGAIQVPVIGHDGGVRGHVYVRAEAAVDGSVEDIDSTLDRANPREGETVLNSMELPR